MYWVDQNWTTDVALALLYIDSTPETQNSRNYPKNICREHFDLIDTTWIILGEATTTVKAISLLLCVISVIATDKAFFGVVLTLFQLPPVLVKNIFEETRSQFDGVDEAPVFSDTPKPLH